MNASSNNPTPFRILHCFRTPVGGLFRHVCDLATEQSALGHEVGIICDSESGGARAEDKLAQMAILCRLGIHRTPMTRQIGFRDWSALGAVDRIAKQCNADILHGHGAKGGAYARLAGFGGAKKARRFYTPHGGSLHYSRWSPQGFVFLNLERILLARTDGLIFESAFAESSFADKIGTADCPRRIIHNGLAPAEFDPVYPAGGAADLLFIGELRELKGVATLLSALASLRERGIEPKTLIIGAGPDEQTFKALADELDLQDRVTFHAPMPAREAFARGRILLVPSHKESFPYIVLEAAAAGIPMIVTRVGGIPEIFGPLGNALIEPANDQALASAIAEALEHPDRTGENASILRHRVHETFLLNTMAREVLEFYAGHGTREPRSAPGQTQARGAEKRNLGTHPKTPAWFD